MINKFAVVLCILFVFLGFGCKNPEFNLKIFGDEEMIGAMVYVDNIYVGKMEKFNEGAYFSKWLHYGSHKIKIEKIGYAPFKEDVVVGKGESEYYMNISYEKSPNSRQTK